MAASRSPFSRHRHRIDHSCASLTRNWERQHFETMQTKRWIVQPAASSDPMTALRADWRTRLHFSSPCWNSIDANCFSCLLHAPATDRVRPRLSESEEGSDSSATVLRTIHLFHRLLPPRLPVLAVAKGRCASTDGRFVRTGVNKAHPTRWLNRCSVIAATAALPALPCTRSTRRLTAPPCCLRRRHPSRTHSP